jgi:hypothetical protein
VKVIYLSTEGTATVEDAPAHKRIIRHLDGDHPVSPSAIYRDRAHKGPSIMVIWQGRPVPEGGPGEGEPAKDGLGDFYLEQSIMKDHHSKPMVSHRWMRQLVAGLVLVGKTFLVSLCIVGTGLLVYVLLVIF